MSLVDPPRDSPPLVPPPPPEPAPPPSPRPSRWWPIAFWAFALILTLGLLWPNAQLPPVINRPDLIVHGVSYGLFTSLLFASRLCVKPRHSARRTWPSLLFTTLVALAYSTATESLQAIPFLKRTSALDDWLANALGILLGVIISATWLLLTRRDTPPRPT